MAVTSFSSGTKTATVATTHTLAQVNEAGVFVFMVDTNAMAAGDVLELRAEKIVLTSGTARGELVGAFYGVQPTDDKIKQSVPIPNDITDTGSINFKLTQTFGTGRAFPWKVIKIA